VSKELVGEAVQIITGKKAVVKLKTTNIMRVDEKGLVHGGFTFGLADYAAMLAVNHPYTVLYKANVTFLKPVRVGDVLTAIAEVIKVEGRKYYVNVEVYKDDKEKVFTGEFLCITLEQHVLDRCND